MGDIHVDFRGKRILLLGFGSIAATVLPMILKHIRLSPDQILILSDDDRYSDVRNDIGVEHVHGHLTPDNHIETLSSLVDAGDCIVNLTGGVSARDLVRFCLESGIDYIDTSNERWEHGAVYNDSADFAQQWNQLISERDSLPKSATALVSHGANPGLVSHFAKQAIENIAIAEGLINSNSGDEPDWPTLAQALNVQALHISERDTQVPRERSKPGEFFNTWSIEGLIEESHSNPCFAWGTHEAPYSPAVLRTDPICVVATLPGEAKDCAIRSWLPGHREFEAAIIPHEEAFSIAELFSSPATSTGQCYQPTVMFAYRPCDEAFEALHDPNTNPLGQDNHVIIAEVESGVDELGILVLRENSKEVYWYGSTLDIHEARDLVPLSNATSLQVAAGVLGGLVWVLENPRQGLVAAEDADHHRVLEVAKPYLGRLKGVSDTWENAPTIWNTADLLQTK